jgi:hypothetical protein
MFWVAWIDWPVDTQDFCFHVLPSAAWKCSHAQATAIRRSSCFGNSVVSESRKLAAILVSDVVGYSRLAGAKIASSHGFGPFGAT